jgi:hypothetical protein
MLTQKQIDAIRAKATKDASRPEYVEGLVRARPAAAATISAIRAADQKMKAAGYIEPVLIGATKDPEDRSVIWTAKKQADGRYLVVNNRRGGATEIYGYYKTVAGARKALKRVFDLSGGVFAK